MVSDRTYVVEVCAGGEGGEGGEGEEGGEGSSRAVQEARSRRSQAALRRTVSTACCTERSVPGDRCVRKNSSTSAACDSDAKFSVVDFTSRDNRNPP